MEGGGETNQDDGDQRYQTAEAAPHPHHSRTSPKGRRAPYFARKYYGEIRNYSRPLRRDKLPSPVTTIGGVAVSAHRLISRPEYQRTDRNVSMTTPSTMRYQPN